MTCSIAERGQSRARAGGSLRPLTRTRYSTIDLMYLWVRGRWYFLVTILDSYSRYIAQWELALSMRAEEIAETTAIALERVHGKKPRIVRDNGSQFVAKEWREVMRYFEVEEIPTRVMAS